MANLPTVRNLLCEQRAPNDVSQKVIWKTNFTTQPPAGTTLSCPRILHKLPEKTADNPSPKIIRKTLPGMRYPPSGTVVTDSFCCLCGASPHGHLRCIDPYGVRIGTKGDTKVLAIAIQELFNIKVDIGRIATAKACDSCIKIVFRTVAMRRHFLAVMAGQETEPVKNITSYVPRVNATNLGATNEIGIQVQGLNKEDVPHRLLQNTAKAPEKKVVVPSIPTPKIPTTKKIKNTSNSAHTRMATLPDGVRLSSISAGNPSILQQLKPQPAQLVLQFSPVNNNIQSQPTPTPEGLVTFTLSGVGLKPVIQKEDHTYSTPIEPAERAKEILAKSGILRNLLGNPRDHPAVQTFCTDNMVRTQIERQILAELSVFCDRINSPKTQATILRTGLEDLPYIDIASSTILEMENGMPFLLDILRTLCCTSGTLTPTSNAKQTIAMMYGMSMFCRNKDSNALQLINSMAMLRYDMQEFQEFLQRSSMVIANYIRPALTRRALQSESLGFDAQESSKITGRRVKNIIDRTLIGQNLPVPKDSPPDEGKDRGKDVVNSKKKSKRLHPDSEPVERKETSVSSISRRLKRRRIAIKRAERAQRAAAKRKRACTADYLHTQVVVTRNPPEEEQQQEQVGENEKSPNSPQNAMSSCSQATHRNEATPSGSGNTSLDIGDTPTKGTGYSYYQTKENRKPNNSSQGISSNTSSCARRFLPSATETQAATQILEGQLETINVDQLFMDDNIHGVQPAATSTTHTLVDDNGTSWIAMVPDEQPQHSHTHNYDSGYNVNQQQSNINYQQNYRFHHHPK